MNKIKLLLPNKKINLNYFVIDSYECGIVLKGNEIKSLVKSNASIDQAFAVTSINDEIYLINMYIKPFENNNTFKKIDPTRRRKLLLNKQEIIKIKYLVQKQKLVLIPIEIYLLNRHIKVKLGLCKHKMQSDKRLDIKKRDMDRVIKKQ